MTRTELIQALDNLCWEARGWGHDDNLLDYAVDVNGHPVEEDDESVGFHPEAVKYADQLLLKIGTWL